MKLSIIIPVYNLENHISRTLESCLMQDLDKEQYEILCINDGSKDRSEEILNKYSKNFPNIRIITKENGGVSSARNKGIEVAKGEYIWFVDGDDPIRANCLGFIVKTMDKEKADLLMHDIKITHKENEKYDVPLNNSEYRVINGVIQIYDSCKRSYGGGACSYVFRRDICINNRLMFREDMKYSEDLLFVFLYKSYCKTAVLVDDYFYYYIMRKTSAIHNINYTHHIYCYFACINEYERIGNLYKGKTHYFEHKLNDCARGIAVDLVAISDIDYAKEIFYALKEKGLYPIKNDLFVLKGCSNIRTKIIALRTIILTHKPICMLVIRLKKLLKRGKK